MRTDGGAQRRLDASYVAEHLQHAYALTAHTIQGGTVEWAGVVGRPEDFTRNWSYTALSRAREPTELFVIDTPTERELDRAEIAPGQARGLRDERTPDRAPRGRHASPRRRGPRPRPPRRRAHPRPSPSPRTPAPAEATVARPSVVELQAELTQLRERIGHYPEHLVDQLHAARSAQAEAQRVADVARARVAELEQPGRAACCAAGAADPPNARWSANASSSPSTKSRRPPSASATSRAASPTARMGGRTPRAPRARRRARRAALEPPPRAPTRRARATGCPTSRRRWALSLTSRALAAPGSRPPRASRPTASTTPSPTPATPSDRPRATSTSARTGNAPTTTSNALSATSVSAIDRRHSHEI